MTWNGSGVFNLLHDFRADKASGAPLHFVTADRMMQQLENIAAGLTLVLTRNGETAPSANLPMAGFRHTGAGAATSGSHYPLANQVASGELVSPSAYSGSGTAWVATIAFFPAAYRAGLTVRGIAPYATTSGAFTLAVNALAAKNVKMPDGTDPIASYFGVGDAFDFLYDGTDWIVNTGFGAQAANKVAFTATGSLSSTNVQAAIAELDGDVTTLASAQSANTSAISALDTRLDTVETDKANLASANFTVLQVGGKSAEIDTVVQSIGPTSGTISPNYASGQVIDISLNGNITLNVPTNAVAGDVVTFRLRQDATGGRTITWSANFLFAGGSDPALSTGANAVDLITGIYRDASNVEMGALFRGFA